MYFDRASSIIKDASKLSFDYVPKTLVHRDTQMMELSMLFRTVVEDGMSETAFLTGNVGTGKTATAKRFCADMAEHCSLKGIPMDYVLVNCRHRNTEAGVLLQIIRHFDQGFPDRGFSPSEMLRIVRKHLSKEGRRFVIILDEVDMLIKKGSGDLIYQLSRFNEDSSGRKISISLILISQEYVLDKLDAASLSSFKRTNTIRFPKYNYEELYGILMARASEALKTDTYSEETIALLADISTEYGDARFAIDLLDKSARSAETRPEGIMTAEDVRTAKAMIYSVVTETKLNSLDLNRLLTLLSISRCIKSEAYVTLAAVEKTYAIVCEEYEVPARKHTQFWTYVKDLDNSGLIKIHKECVEGIKSPVSYVSVPDIPSKVLAKKLESILDEYQ